ncbi:Maf-like protein Pcar_0404 [uncultured Desulfobacterium sp.]|uniref:dTTP/UTP pyrophosphatase n=1 Tax=uncultured Desulfobacterium sp. TaxID=201089 RepID=A0A445N2W0_9BACT|nr:Maf-like protein Pcar_0404 [uncultured Desulfobacterium sp.]
MPFPFIDNLRPLILASASPRRKDLLNQIRIPFRSEVSDVTEEDLCANPQNSACRLAVKKAKEVFINAGGSWILGADTIVAAPNGVPAKEVEDEGPLHILLGKPTDEAEAARMLRLLSGKSHMVVTGFCILEPTGGTAHLEAVTSMVRLKDLTDREIESYVATREPLGKAGGYAIQGIGSFMVSGISGSYTNIVGLPLYELIQALVKIGAIRGFPLSPD